MRAEALAQKIQLHRDNYLQGSHADQGFTAEDVKASSRVFARSHKARDRWLRMILGIQRYQPLDETLDEMTDTFFVNVAELAPDMHQDVLQSRRWCTTWPTKRKFAKASCI